MPTSMHGFVYWFDDIPKPLAFVFPYIPTYRIVFFLFFSWKRLISPPVQDNTIEINLEISTSTWFLSLGQVSPSTKVLLREA